MATKQRTDVNTNFEFEGIAATAQTIIKLNQLDDDEGFIDFAGTAAADQTKSISFVNGDGVVNGPADKVLVAGWDFAGMVRVQINGVDRWIPFYTEDV
jgi:hypothetical protein